MLSTHRNRKKYNKMEEDTAENNNKIIVDLVKLNMLVGLHRLRCKTIVSTISTLSNLFNYFNVV